MAPVKISAFVLKISPYRETSAILILLTEHHGIIHALAKGVRRPKSGVPVLERGFLIECMLYIHMHRELQTLGTIAITDFFEECRADIGKIALRDAAFEAILTAIKETEHHLEIFTCIAEFMHRCVTQPGAELLPGLLWKFYGDFSGLLGFSIHFAVCSVCGCDVLDKGGFLLPSDGRIVCDVCQKKVNTGGFLPGIVCRFLHDNQTHFGIATAFSRDEKIRITRLLATFCRYHFDVQREYKALQFLEGLL